MRPRSADWSIDAILPAPKGDYVAASRLSARSEPGQPIDVADHFLAAFALADRLVELPLLTHDGTPADGGDKPVPPLGSIKPERQEIMRSCSRRARMDRWRGFIS
ncbi:MAG TPA: hypothetical protein VIF61_16185 [Methylocystis sp.]